MIKLQEIINSAKKGNIISSQALYCKYFYLVEHSYERYQLPYSDSQEYYDKQFNQYFEKDYVSFLQNYLYSSFFNQFHIRINDSNIKAREILIKRYTFCV